MQRKWLKAFGCRETHPGKFFLITCTVDATCKGSEKTFSVSISIGQHNASEIFAVKCNVVSEISTVLLNDVFAELDERVESRILLATLTD